MEIRQIKHVLAVAETGSFTKASERVSISQPALSASIAKLEDEFKVKLFDRLRSRVVPTAPGLRFIEKANSILNVYNSVKLEMRKEAMPQPLRIGILRTLSSRPISSLLRYYRASKSGAAVSVYDGNESELQKRLRENRLDAVITSATKTPAGWQARTLFKERFVLAVPIDHRFAREESLRLTDLHGEALISRTSCETFKDTVKLLAARGIKPRIAYVTDQDDRALSLVSAGVGVAIVPELFEVPGIVQVSLADLNIVRRISVYWSSGVGHKHLADFIKIASTHDWKARL